jgi:hypothetical protein
MRYQMWMAAVLLTLAAAAPGRAAEPCCCAPPQPSWLTRIAPVGGFCPYGAGLLSWWPRHCFPGGGAPDDYCRKPLPRVCWPPYPPYYTWGPPDVSSPSGSFQMGNGEQCERKPRPSSEPAQ